MKQQHDLGDSPQIQLDFLARQNRKLLRRIAELEKQAMTDSLTGIANRRSFDLELERALAAHARYDWEFCLLVFDIDKFKEVNDTYGHPFGDKVLREVTDRVQQVIRDSDHFSRIGGDEFAVILNGANRERAEVAGKRIADLVRGATIVNDQLAISVSYGIALPSKSMGAGELLAQADRAMYARKR